MMRAVNLFSVVIEPAAIFSRPAAREWKALLYSFYVAWMLAATSLFAGNFYAGTSPANVPWPGGIVPYEFTNTLTAAQQKTYFDGLREWQLAANVNFVPHTTETRWILFAYNTNYIDNVSPGFNPQVVTVSSLSRAQVCHEMGHSFGFTHENIRPDQTNFLTVISNNVTDGNLQFFQIDPNSVTNGNYDFESVMHLGWDFASTQPGVLATQQPKPPFFPRYQFRMGNLCLSPGDRAALKFLYGPPVVPLTNIVTTTADFGPGSLRAAMYYATDHPGSIVQFNIPTSDAGYSNGVFNIHLTGHLPPLAANGMVIDGSTQPGFTGNPLIFVDGSQIIPETFTSNSGLLIYSSSNQVKNISFAGFNWNGLTLEFADAMNNTISGCWLGLDATGTNAAPNAFQGILFSQGASHNFIGGTNALARNVISGNAQYGLWMSDSNTTANTVLGNYIGTDASGSLAVPNAFGGIGMFYNSVGHVIGGTNALARNVISGNGTAGIWLSGAGVSNDIVQGNFIGTDASGTTAVPNSFVGVYLLNGASGNLIGGTSAGAHNVISANQEYGIYISDPGTSNNLVQGNFIGTDVTGTNALGNGSIGIGIWTGASGNLIGGAATGAGNLISGNIDYGLVSGGANDNVIQGNLIGTDRTGTNALANEFTGLAIWGAATNNLVGGTTTGTANVISGNITYGVFLSDSNTSGNFVEGNFIGTDISGTNALANGFAGLAVYDSASGNFIGGTTTGTANIISGNYYGVLVSNAGTSGNFVQGNFIGTDISGTNALGNGFANVVVQGGALGNFIGGVTTGAGNVIAFSGGTGVLLYDPETTNNSIRGNSIFSNGALGIDLVSTNDVYPYVTPNDFGDADSGPNDLQNFPVITNAFGSGAGTIISGTLNSLANSTFFIDVYRNLAPNFSGYGEGKFYVGTASATTDGSGNGIFSLTNFNANYAGQFFTATATAAGGDTSEFSADVLATNAATAFAQFAGPFQSSASGFIFNLALQTNFNYRIQAATNLLNPILWIDLTNFAAASSSLTFTDRTATNFHTRFYRIVSP